MKVMEQVPVLREGRVVGPCWEKLEPKGPKVSAYGGTLNNLKDLKDGSSLPFPAASTSTWIRPL